MKQQNKHHTLNQAGMVSIIVTMVLMVVISLIVLGFAQISRREQRQSLDTQLSTQAFYAAESGVNDAVKALTATGGYPGYNVGGGNDSTTHNKTHCAPDPSGLLSSNDVNTSTNTQYTCLLINETPTKLFYSPVDSGQAISADINFLTAAGAAASVDHMVIEWGASNGPSTFPSSVDTFPTTGSWGATTAVGRLQLTNFGGSASANDYSRTNLNDTTFTAFLYPKSSGGSGKVNFPATPISPATQGPIIDGDCITTCTMEIDGLNTPHVFLRLGSIYASSSFTITAYGSPGNTNPLEMTGGQAVIDSTGKAQDVLRRIQVYVSLNTKGSPMIYAVQAVDGICKNFQVGVGFGADPSGCISP